MADSTSENGANATENASSSAPKAEQEDTEDWDKSREGAAYQSLGRSGGRNLAQLMKLPEEEEKNVEAELGKWINADPNPYEAPEASKDQGS